MKHLTTYGRAKFGNALFLLLIFLSCNTAQPLATVDRTVIPTADATVPSTNSEIRELKFQSFRQEDDHKDLHFTGQVFTKTTTNGVSQISPCNKCIIQLTTPGDTSVRINLTTESDGYFLFEGKNAGYTMTLNNPGHNRLEIGPIYFETEGITNIKIINAAGASSEKFIVTKQRKNYSWSRMAY